jgi:hypothetical protein
MFLHIYLLDGAQGLIVIPLFFIHVGLTILIESVILKAYKYGTFGRCARDIFIVNLISLVIGLCLMAVFYWLTDRLTEGTSVANNQFLLKIITLVPYYIETVLAEGFFLWLLNRKWPVKKLIPATLLMNLATYILLYFMLQIDIDSFK